MSGLRANRVQNRVTAVLSLSYCLAMRKLATIRRVLELSPIEGADLIEVATVDGWRTVVKKGEFRAGDLAVYFEIDSWIPKAVAPFLFKGKKYQDIEGARLQTIRLQKQMSQGLLRPMSVLGLTLIDHEVMREGDDVTAMCGVLLWEPPPPKGQKFQSGRPAGNFPSFLRKTDQERVQNLRRELGLWAAAGEQWEVTEKLDGTSFTAFKYEGRTGVCSRNFELKEDDETSPSLYWQVAKSTGILDDLEEGFAVQGEIIGPGICGNKYGLRAPELYVFDVFSIGEQRYLLPNERAAWLSARSRAYNHVPILLWPASTPGSVDEALARAEGQSTLVAVEREGLVWKSFSRPLSWKSISNTWLLAHKS